jgi:hypothetical protein
MIKLSKKEMNEMADRVWKRIAAHLDHYKILEITGYFDNCKMN